jgi:hypothetical protein
MSKVQAKTKGTQERGMAMLLALFAMLLISAIGLFMVLASNTETRIDANYSSSLRSYYAARSGLEEVRDRMTFPSTSHDQQGGLADLLPMDVAGNAGGVLYVLNPANGETVDPTDITSPYFDDQLCHDFNSGVAAKDSKCTVQPTTANWNMASQASNFAVNPPTMPLNYKWIRINMKTNRAAAPYCVDGSFNNATQSCAAASLDTRVCWDGQTEQLSPGGASPACDVNGMQTVYMLTSLAATPQTGGPNGSRKLLRLEVVAPSIRPSGVVTLGASSTAPTLSNNSNLGIPSIAIDGRPHDLSGNLIPPSGSSTTSSSSPATAANSCSAIAPLATDSAAGTAQLEQALNLVRNNIVTQANKACYQDGSNTTGNICTYGLWWVRGTDTLPRFISGGSSTTGSTTATSTTTTATSTTSSSTTSSGSTPGGSGSGGGRNDDDSHGGHNHHNDPTGAPDPSGACDASNPACFTNLDLAAPELFATSAVTSTSIPIATTLSDSIAPFTGGKGNQSDASVYQPAASNIINNEIAAINQFATASKNDPNYYTASSATLAGNYGTSTSPAIVAFTDQILSLQGAASLTGYGVLIIPSALEISNSGTLNWNGIVVIQSPTGHVTISSGANGFINGALLVQPGAAVNLVNSAPSATCGTKQQCTAFRITYSCAAIDLPFNSKPFKIISTAENSF